MAVHVWQLFCKKQHAQLADIAGDLGVGGANYLPPLKQKEAGALDELLVEPTYERSEEFFLYPHEVAAIYDQLDLIKWLACVSSESLVMSTLNYATENGHLHIVRWLIEESGESVDCRDCNNWETYYLEVTCSDFDDWPEPCQQYLFKARELLDLI